MSYSLVNISPTICTAMGVPMMAESCTQPIDSVVNLLQGDTVERCLFFSPDAIGGWLFDKYAHQFAPVLALVPEKVPLNSVMPSVTPVCYGSMMSGVMPSVHGIERYEKYPLNVSTLFHALHSAGKRSAIIATADSSCEIIFRNTPADIFVVNNDKEALAKGLELIACDTYDFLLVYQCEYDDFMHKTQPESQKALDAMGYHIESFLHLAKAAKARWAGRKSLLTFSPDHGIHIDPVTRLGTHGTSLDMDIKIYHLFGVS